MRRTAISRRSGGIRRVALALGSGGLGLLAAGAAAAPASAASTFDATLTESRLSIGTVRDVGGPASGALSGGSITDDGRSVLVPLEGVHLPDVAFRWGNARVRTALQPVSALTGELRPATGSLALNGRFNVVLHVEGLPATEHVGTVACAWRSVLLTFGDGPVAIPTWAGTAPAKAITYRGALDAKTGDVVLAGTRQGPMPAQLEPITTGAGPRTDSQVCADLATQLHLPTALGLQLRGVVKAPGVIPYSGPRTPRLRVSFGKVARVSRGRTARVRVRIRNTGRATARDIDLKATGPDSIEVANPRAHRNRLRPRQSATVTLRVRTGSRTRSGTRVRVRVEADGVKARAWTVALRIR